MARYEMKGTQAVTLQSGQTLAPQSGEFEADLNPVEEDFLLKIGAIRKVVKAPVSGTIVPTVKA